MTASPDTAQGPAASIASTFADRHIGPGTSDAEHMLEVLGYPSLEKLVDIAVPASIRLDRTLNLPAALSEPEVHAADDIGVLVGRLQQRAAREPNQGAACVCLRREPDLIEHGRLPR